MNKLFKISLTLSLSYFLTFSFSNAQNLIPNPDFELGPDSSAEGWDWNVSGPDFWDSTSGSPDRIYYGDTLSSRDMDTAQSGLAYVMFWGLDTVFGFPVEAGKATLISPLQVGKTYKLSYYLDIDDFFYSGPAGIAFKFNNGGDSIPSPLQPNTGKWEYYDTTFVASAASTEIELINIANGISPTLVKIDNISLELDTNTAIADNFNLPESIKVYPNPFIDNTSIIITPYKIENPDRVYLTLYDILGNKQDVYYSLFSSNTEVNIKLQRGNLMAGIYIAKIQIDKTTITKKLTIIN